MCSDAPARHGTYHQRFVPLEERFWQKVNKHGPVPAERPDLGPCWLWTGFRLPKGYGRFRTPNGVMQAHRFAYELLFGPVPAGFVLDHLCRRPSCVNAFHLEPVTNRVNVLRGISPPAQFAKATHCIRGHEFDANNTGRQGNGGRYCRMCDNLRRRREKAA